MAVWCCSWVVTAFKTAIYDWGGGDYHTSLGLQPRIIRQHNLRAEGPTYSWKSNEPPIGRAFSPLRIFRSSSLGRWPGLGDFGPLGLNSTHQCLPRMLRNWKRPSEAPVKKKESKRLTCCSISAAAQSERIASMARRRSKSWVMPIRGY